MTQSLSECDIVMSLACFHVTPPLLSVVISPYRVVVHEEQVMLGNSVLMGCNIPSFVSDFVSVVGWTDSQGQNLKAGNWRAS